MTRLADMTVGKRNALDAQLTALGVTGEHIEELLRNPALLAAWARSLEAITNLTLDAFGPGMKPSLKELGIWPAVEQSAETPWTPKTLRPRHYYDDALQEGGSLFSDIDKSA